MSNQVMLVSDISKLVQDATEGLPSSPDEHTLQGCAFDVRRALIDKTVQDIIQNTDEDLTLDAQEYYEDILRKALPPMLAPSLKLIPKASALRAALLAVLGLLLGSAIGQGLSMVQGLGLGSASVVLCGILGVTSMLWLSEYLLHAASVGTVVLPWGTYKWPKARKIFTLFWFGLLALSIVRDFFGGRAALAHILESLALFFNSGDVLGIFTNIYGVLAFMGAAALLLKRPKIFDRDDFSQKLEVAAQNWWGNAQLAAKLLVENHNLKNDPTRKNWQQVGRDIYSFSAELPEAQQQWLVERLYRLGLEAPRAEGALTWQKDMLEHYVPLGHIDIGDSCYVDEPPILENGLIVRKGTVRKIR